MECLPQLELYVHTIRKSSKPHAFGKYNQDRPIIYTAVLCLTHWSTTSTMQQQASRPGAVSSSVPHDGRSIELCTQKSGSSGTRFLLPVHGISDYVNALAQQDRCLAYVLPCALPVHLYLEVDADRHAWSQPTRDHPQSTSEEHYIEALMCELNIYFESHDGFKRPLDMSGLLLLQGSSSTRITWRVHITSEAFQDAHQHQLFVRSFLHFLQERADAAADAAEGESDSDSDDEQRAASRATAVTLCRFDPNPNQPHQMVAAQPAQGSYHHLLRDPGERTQAERFLLLPYNHQGVATKENSEHWDILRVRTHELDCTCGTSD
jgi:hypothetical protein